MATSGKSDQELHLAELIDFMVIPQNHSRILSGIEGLLNIHINTNQIVKQENQRLADVITEKDTLRSYVLALNVEVAEFIQTLDWKPWKNGKQESRERVLDEFADILAFLGVLITILHARGFSAQEIAEAYVKKEHVNVARFIATMKEDEHAHIKTD